MSEANKGDKKSIEEYLTPLHEIITTYIGKTFLYISKENYIPLPTGEWKL